MFVYFSSHISLQRGNCIRWHIVLVPHLLTKVFSSDLFSYCINVGRFNLTTISYLLWSLHLLIFSSAPGKNKNRENILYLILWLVLKSVRVEKACLFIILDALSESLKDWNCSVHPLCCLHLNFMCSCFYRVLNCLIKF